MDLECGTEKSMDGVTVYEIHSSVTDVCEVYIIFVDVIELYSCDFPTGLCFAHPISFHRHQRSWSGIGGKYSRAHLEDPKSLEVYLEYTCCPFNHLCKRRFRTPCINLLTNLIALMNVILDII